MKKLLFIPMDYQYKPHMDYFYSFSKYYDCLYYTDQAEAVEFSPEVVFTQSSAIPADKLKEIKDKSKAFIIQWTGDCREELLSEVLAYKGICDLTLLAAGIAQKELYEKALGHPVSYLQHGVEQSQFIPVKTDLVDKKVVFIGNAYSQFPGGVERNDLCAILSKKFPNFEVWGNGFNLPEYRNPNSIPYLETFNLYNNSYIGISANIFNDKEGYFSNRPLDIMASGSCCLMRHVPNIEKIFKNLEHCVIYKTPEEAISEIEFLMDNPDVRNRIAKAGQDQVRKFHTYEYRVQEITQYIKHLI